MQFHIDPTDTVLYLKQDTEFSIQDIFSMKFEPLGEDETKNLIAFRIDSQIRKKQLLLQRMKELCKIVESHNPYLAARLAK